MLFSGSNLAFCGMETDYDITIFDNLSWFSSINYYEWLKILRDFTFIYGNTRSKNPSFHAGNTFIKGKWLYPFLQEDEPDR